ncbi:hypothetical protein SAMN05216203_1048 [Marinobacter daqiaonensis]|uniref:Uncharacterized protein n=1 Tax=Marinobacter daqiaonensis TaxID=650891 RepID=A0A1I6HB50_9GAMM|nr:hypothetical protein [Marinobacter daqiaonensis]SFR51497.1 hypothetical protein SAMN05216203_1048 [Marinobacter daqiaonensis]
MMLSHRPFILPRLLTRAAIAVIAILVMAGTAQAESLTDSKIRSFIDSLESAQALGDEYPELEQDMADDNDMPDLTRLFSSSLAKLDRNPQIRGKLKNIVVDHGFDSLESWGRTGDRIYAALVALEMGGQAAKSAREMEQALAEVENNPNISDAQKAEMRQRMSAAMSGMEAAQNVPEADKQAVRPFVDELEALGDE